MNHETEAHNARAAAAAGVGPEVLYSDGRHGIIVTRFVQDAVPLDAKRAGALNVEMESSTILTLASLFGLRAGCICTVSDRTPWPGPGQDSLTLDKNMDGMIDVAIDAMKRLA